MGDLSVPENNGLGLIIDSLSSAVSAVEGNLSRADVWALAASMAIEAAGGPEIEFQTGRIDNNSCGGHGERLPNAELGRSHIVDVMVTKLNFSERETAALMGAHVLAKRRDLFRVTMALGCATLVGSVISISKI